MARITVDGEQLEIGDDERINGIEAAARLGVDVPHYCWHPGLTVVASCRMCLVETGTADPQTGDITMLPKLVPACQTPAKDGTVFLTDTEKVRQARAMVEEDLLIDHPIDCPICDKAGECRLQDYHFQHGQGERRADIRPFTSRRRSMGDTVTLFVDRCVMCSRCVRFTREISGTSELMVTHRGNSEEIDVFPGFPLDNKLSGNVVDLCPVGALGDKHFLYSQRVWFMKERPSVCGGCSQGCSIYVDENQDRIYRLRPRDNPHVNEWWICDEGRYGFEHLHSESRVTLPQRKNSAGDRELIDMARLAQQLVEEIREVGHLAVVLSPHLTVEDAYLLARCARAADPQATLALGPVPQEGEDERFRNGFTIRAEKCPNRRGVEKIVAHFMDRIPSLDDVVEELAADTSVAVWVTGGYRDAWLDRDLSTALADAALLIVQDLFPSPVWDAADYQLPGVAFAEREGSYVNCNDWLQSFAWAIRAPAGTSSELRLAWRMLGRSGLATAPQVLAELASEIPFFSAALGGVSEYGVNLRANLLADQEVSSATTV